MENGKYGISTMSCLERTLHGSLQISDDGVGEELLGKTMHARAMSGVLHGPGGRVHGN